MPERRVIAYLLKAYPRASETFILSEIERLERTGVPLRLFVIKPAEPHEREPRHPTVDRIRTPPEFLLQATSIRSVPFHRWLLVNLWRFRGALARTARRRPIGLVRAAVAVVAQAARARRRPWAWPDPMYAKEFLQAVALADRLIQAPDVGHLHAHYAHGTTTVAWLAAMMRGLPFSFTGHARDIYCEALNPAGLLRRKLRAARFAVTCAETSRAFLQRVARGTPIHRVYHGLNEDFSRLVGKGAAHRRPGLLRVLGVGRLVRKKGFDILIEAAARLHGEGIGLEVVIIGGRDVHAAELRALIAARGLDDVVQLVGPIDQASLYEEYRRASVFCLPCRVHDDGDRDGIPNVLVEAMAAGVPVVTTRVSGIPELVTDGINGCLVPPEDPGALAAALRRVALDPALATRLAHAGEATVRERFNGDLLARQLTSLFREALA